MPEITEDEQRRLIERALTTWGLNAESWENDPDNGDRLKATIGDAEVHTDDEDHGLFEGDSGKMTASVVGGLEYGNLRVAFYFEDSVREGGEEITPDGSVVELT